MAQRAQRDVGDDEAPRLERIAGEIYEVIDLAGELDRNAVEHGAGQRDRAEVSEVEHEWQRRPADVDVDGDQALLEREGDRGEAACGKGGQQQENEHGTQANTSGPVGGGGSYAERARRFPSACRQLRRDAGRTSRPVFFDDGQTLGARSCRFANLPDARPRGLGGRFVLDDRRGVVASDHAAGGLLLQGRRGFRPREVGVGQSFEFGQPPSQEHAHRIVIGHLLARRVDAQRVDAGHAALHLHLRVVDAGLEVQEETREDFGGVRPVQPEMVAREAHQHGAHAEVDPAGRVQRAHAGVDHGVAGVAGAPGLQARGIELGFAQAVVDARHVGPLEIGLVFELLRKVTVPAQPLLETRQRTQPRPGDLDAGVTLGLQFLAACDGGLEDLAHGDRAVGEVGAEPAALVDGGHRARHGLLVVDRAAAEEGVEHVVRASLAARLHVGAFAGRQPECFRRKDADGLGCAGRPGGRFERDRRRHSLLVHALAPARGPAVTVAQRAEDAVLRQFGPRHALGAAPGRDAPIAGVGGIDAGLLVAPQAAETSERAMEGVEDARDLAAKHVQARSAGPELTIEVFEAFVDEDEMRRIVHGSVEHVRFVDVETEDRPAFAGGDQGSVVAQAQVAFEPDEVDGSRCVGHDRRIQGQRRADGAAGACASV